MNREEQWADGVSALEIERKFLLDGLPSIPGGAEVWHIEQGYVPPDPRAPDGMRIRRTAMSGGHIVCTQTIKRGSGLVRTEMERTISESQFHQLWARTAGRRINKIRHRVREKDVTWEIDQFQGIDLVLAEVELPSADIPLRFPNWVMAHMLREVTDDPQYTNFAIAERSSRSS